MMFWNASKLFLTVCTQTMVVAVDERTIWPFYVLLAYEKAYSFLNYLSFEVFLLIIVTKYPALYLLNNTTVGLGDLSFKCSYLHEMIPV